MSVWNRSLFIRPDWCLRNMFRVFLSVSQFSTQLNRFQAQPSKPRGYLREMDLFRIFGALLLWPESETSWWICSEQRRSNQAGLSSHQTMLRQEETMCQDNNAKWWGSKYLMTWTCLRSYLETHANYFTCVCLAHCTVHTEHNISRNIHCCSYKINPIPVHWTQGECSSP